MALQWCTERLGCGVADKRNRDAAADRASRGGSGGALGLSMIRMIVKRGRKPSRFTVRRKERRRGLSERRANSSGSSSANSFETLASVLRREIKHSFSRTK